MADQRRGAAKSIRSNLSTIATIYHDDPKNPDNPTSSKETVQLHYETGDSTTRDGLAGQMDIYSDDYLGHIMLDVEVGVQEVYASTDVTSTSSIGIIDSQNLIYEEKYYKDRENCSAEFHNRISHIIGVVPNFKLILPDPPPDIIKGIRIMVELGGEIRKIATKKPHLAHQMARTLAHSLNVPEYMLLRSRRKSKSLIKRKNIKNKKSR